MRLDFESFNIKGNTATTETIDDPATADVVEGPTHNCPNDKMQASVSEYLECHSMPNPYGIPDQ